MSPSVTVIKYALLAIFFGVPATCAWANSRMMKRGRESGYPFWHPMAAVSAWRGPEILVFIVALGIGAIVFIGLQALQ